MIELIRLLFDTGLLILIWIVQLIIYPSFVYYSEKNLLTWHKIYTTQITIIVMPLMLGQIFLAFYQLTFELSIYSISSIIMISLIWLNTFLIAIPLHAKIDNQVQVIDSAKKLVQINWWRTVLWTIIFVYTIFQVFLFKT